VQFSGLEFCLQQKLSFRFYAKLQTLDNVAEISPTVLDFGVSLFGQKICNTNVQLSIFAVPYEFGASGYLSSRSVFRNIAN
jgi:hypothetical protein